MARNCRTFAAVFCTLSMILAACGSGEPGDAALANSSTTTSSAAPTTSAAEPADEAAATTVAPETESDPAEATVSTDPPPQPADFLSGPLLAPAGERTLWTGTIDDDIDFSLWLAQQDGYLRGELTYRTSGIPITVLGRSYASGDAYFLHEFGDDGNVTGSLILGNVSNGEIADASWGERNLELSFDGVSADPYFFDPLVRSGVYTYGFGPYGEDDELCCGPTGYLQISEVTASSLRLEIENVTGGPGYNLALIDPVEIPLVNNVARYELVDGDIADCAFDITVFDGFAFIDHVDERFDCLFGNAAGVEGIYLRTGDIVEPSDSTFYDASLTSTGFGGVALGDTWRSLTDRFDAPPFSEADDFFGGECYYLQIPNDSLSPWFMMLGDGDDAIVSRIEPILPSQRTDTGLGIGDSEADVDAIYGDAVEKTPHQYLGDGAKYLRIRPADGAQSTLLFETDESGTITMLRNGYLDPIRWIEGCA